MSRWVKYYTKSETSALWQLDKEKCKFAAWLYIYSNAAFKSMPVRFRGLEIFLERGEFVFTYRSLAEVLGWNERKTYIFVKWLIKQNMITLINHGKYSILSVVNYDKYQSMTDFEDETHSDQTTSMFEEGSVTAESEQIRNPKTERNAKRNAERNTPEPVPMRVDEGMRNAGRNAKRNTQAKNGSRNSLKNKAVELCWGDVSKNIKNIRNNNNIYNLFFIKNTKNISDVQEEILNFDKNIENSLQLAEKYFDYGIKNRWTMKNGTAITDLKKHLLEFLIHNGFINLFTRYVNEEF